MIVRIRTHFLVCARVLMTSLAANNILPFRIGDIMRIFTYADDLGTRRPPSFSAPSSSKSSSTSSSLVLMFVSTVGRVATPHLRLIANISLAISAIGLLVLLVAARSLASADPAPLRPPSYEFQTRQKSNTGSPSPSTLPARLGVIGSLLCFCSRPSSSGPAKA